jgi:hypothetical protein
MAKIIDITSRLPVSQITPYSHRANPLAAKAATAIYNALGRSESAQMMANEIYTRVRRTYPCVADIKEAFRDEG